MVSDFGSATISIDDLQVGHVSDLLAEAHVVIAVDASTHEKDLVVLRVEFGADEVLMIHADRCVGDQPGKAPCAAEPANLIH